MEAPSSWGPVERAIADGMQEAEQARADGIIGLSSVRRIADKLRERGLVVDEGCGCLAGNCTCEPDELNARIRDELRHA